MSDKTPVPIRPKHDHADLLEAMRCPDCHSFTPAPAAPTERLRGLAEQIADDAETKILFHIDEMYPDMWKGVAKSARTSIRNMILNQAPFWAKLLAASEAQQAERIAELENAVGLLNDTLNAALRGKIQADQEVRKQAMEEAAAICDVVAGESWFDQVEEPMAAEAVCAKRIRAHALAVIPAAQQSLESALGERPADRISIDDLRNALAESVLEGGTSGAGNYDLEQMARSLNHRPPAEPTERLRGLAREIVKTVFGPSWLNYGKGQLDSAADEVIALIADHEAQQAESLPFTTREPDFVPTARTVRRKGDKP